MSETSESADESAFGVGGESSHEADIDSAYGDNDVATVGGGGADETTPDSHTSDIDAGFDDESDSPTIQEDPLDQ